jgi:hypothetical protein
MMRQRSTSKSRWLRIAEVNMRLPTCPSCSVHVQWRLQSDGNLRLQRPVLTQKDLYSSLSSMIIKTMEKCLCGMYCLVWDYSGSKEMIFGSPLYEVDILIDYTKETVVTIKTTHPIMCTFSPSVKKGKIFLLRMESNLKDYWISQWEINLILQKIGL